MLYRNSSPPSSAPNPTPCEFDFLVHATNPELASKFTTPHSDVIYDISFDSQKRRLASCSADQTVFIWTLDDSGKWVRDSSIKEHGGTAWKVTWAHPQFGQILATCSFDNKRVRLFEAVPGDNNDLGRKRWVAVNSFEDRLNNLVTDVKFTPPHIGLALGMCSVDGYVRIMGAENDLKSWKEIVHINIKYASLACLAFSESTRSNLLVAVGSEVISHEDVASDYDSKQQSYFNLFQVDIKPTDRGKPKNMSFISFDDSKLNVDSPVRACCFAPVLGRSFQLLAIGSATMIVYQIKSSNALSRTSLSYPPNFNNPHCAIWRLAWNITGTQLVGSTTHGNVFVWRLSNGCQWDLVSCKSKNSSPSIERPLTDHSTAS